MVIFEISEQLATVRIDFKVLGINSENFILEIFRPP